MLGVKIVLMIFAISLVWTVITNAMLNNTDSKTKERIKDQRDFGPWWYTLDGVLILIDLLGFIYIAAYFIFCVI